MTITDKNELIINIDGRTKLITKDQIIKAFAEPKLSCANYERDNAEEECSELIKKAMLGNDFVKVEQIGQRLKFTGGKNTKDKIVEAVRQKLLDRSQVGIKKYGTTLKDNTKDNYLNHLQMELMDACNYLEVSLQQKEDITQIVKDEPNDMALGRKIRKIYGSKD